MAEVATLVSVLVPTNTLMTCHSVCPGGFSKTPSLQSTTTLDKGLNTKVNHTLISEDGLKAIKKVLDHNTPEGLVKYGLTFNCTLGAGEIKAISCSNPHHSPPKEMKTDENMSH